MLRPGDRRQCHRRRRSGEKPALASGERVKDAGAGIERCKTARDQHRPRCLPGGAGAPFRIGTGRLAGPEYLRSLCDVAGGSRADGWWADAGGPAEAGAMSKSTYGQILRSTALIGSASVATIAINIVRTKGMAVLLGPTGFGLMGLYAG
jgi:hypothetical protein